MKYTVTISDISAGTFIWTNATADDNITQVVYEFVTLTD